MEAILNSDSLDILFRTARTFSEWQDRPVSDDLLRQIYNLLRWAPTSANCCPMRVVFLRTAAAKERLRPALAPLNVVKTMTAPVTAIVAYDLRFYEKLAMLLPHNPAIRSYFDGNQRMIETTAQRNSALQGAYLMLAARSLGLDCGPMSGFNNELVDAEFFSADPGESVSEHPLFPADLVRSNFLCNLGYGKRESLRARSPRLEFDEACALI